MREIIKPKFFLGTTNEHKIEEIRKIIEACGCELVVTESIDPEETEPDFVGNAILKARVYAAYTDGMTISEDSGLIVPSLHGLPGPWSARFDDCRFDGEGHLTSHCPTGRKRTEIDLANNLRVLELMKGIEMPHRAAEFRVVLAVALPSGAIPFKAEGSSYGWIAPDMRGNEGFGYDPIFIGQETHGQTYAEIPAEWKNSISHRRSVMDAFTGWLSRFVRQG